MNKIELVRKVNDWSKPRRKDYYTDDFQLTNAQGAPPSDRDATLAMGELMQSAMPDVRTVIEDIREEGDDVLVTSHWEGTFVNDFDLSAMGLGVAPATGKAVVFPTSTVRISFDGDKISRIHNPATEPGTGTAGFLKALGVEMG
jgi:thiamine pyrophosphate-dependent acetolactate synthase large subunit-like protein